MSFICVKLSVPERYHACRAASQAFPGLSAKAARPYSLTNPDVESAF
jgi:hypothetical protein